VDHSRILAVSTEKPAKVGPTPEMTTLISERVYRFARVADFEWSAVTLRHGDIRVTCLFVIYLVFAKDRSAPFYVCGYVSCLATRCRNTVSESLKAIRSARAEHELRATLSQQAHKCWMIRRA